MIVENLYPPAPSAYYVHILRLNHVSESLDSEVRYKIVSRISAFTHMEESLNLRITYKIINGRRVLFVEYNNEDSIRGSTFGREVAYCIRDYMNLRTMKKSTYFSQIAILSHQVYKSNPDFVKAAIESLSVDLHGYDCHKEPVIHDNNYWVGFSLIEDEQENTPTAVRTSYTFGTLRKK